MADYNILNLDPSSDEIDEVIVRAGRSIAFSMEFDTVEEMGGDWEVKFCRDPEGRDDLITLSQGYGVNKNEGTKTITVLCPGDENILTDNCFLFITVMQSGIDGLGFIAPVTVRP